MTTRFLNTFSLGKLSKNKRVLIPTRHNNHFCVESQPSTSHTVRSQAMMGAMSCLECMNAVLRAAAYDQEGEQDEETAKVWSGN